MSWTRSTTPSTASSAGSSTRKETKWSCGNRPKGNERARSRHPAAIDHVSLAGREAGFIARQIQRERGDLLGLSEAPKRLARLELRARLCVIAIRMQACLQRGSVDRARANGIAAHALRYEIGGHGLCQADHGRLGGAVGAAIRHPGDGP